MTNAASPDWSAGLLPCIVQDARTGMVLMQAWMNEEAFERTRQTGQAWFWSRSRQGLWRKGETSGHTQQVVGVRIDCDADAILLEVIPNGPACHTGQPACFYRAADDGESLQGPTLNRLERVIADRVARRPEGSYTTSLIAAGLDVIGAKVAEEAQEVVQAARGESDDRATEEAADLLYHLLVLLAARGIALAAVLDVLRRRAAPSRPPRDPDALLFQPRAGTS